MSKIHIAVFASGNGTNAENLFKYFHDHPEIEICLLVCNKKGAPVIQKAIDNNVPVQEINREIWQNEEYILNMLESYKTDLIVLAGFLWLVPGFLISKYSNKILNLHPALLPKYGGHGMYGMKVHESVRKNNETESGISIHLVNNNYDEGQILFQQSCPVLPDDTPQDIADKVHRLEYACLPATVEKYALQMFRG
jgi:phosphoribosylglycinamide formyltransferase-1